MTFMLDWRMTNRRFYRKHTNRPEINQRKNKLVRFKKKGSIAVQLIDALMSQRNRENLK
jgi:hypothetical protein